jgi:hypothetical protein
MGIPCVMLGDKLHPVRQNSAVCIVLQIHVDWRVNVYLHRNLNFALGFGRNIMP